MGIISAEIEVILGDITQTKADAIVNAANSSLMGGGGVDGAIHRAGGKSILEECQLIVNCQGKCPAGEAVITTAGNLPARFVIHTVGPIWFGGKADEAETLSNCYLNTLKLAIENDCRTIAFPNISTGVYRFPKEEAAQVAFEAVYGFLRSNTDFGKIIFVCLDPENYQLTKKKWNC